MPDEKISQLPDGASPQAGDEFPIARAGANYSLTWSEMSTAQAAATTVTESQISLSDVTTDNVSPTKHGFTPKLPNDATKYLDGTGAYSVPPGTGTQNDDTIYVAAPTGVAATDNAAIAAAITSCPSGGVVHLQHGTYALTGLTINKPLTLRGTGGANAGEATAIKGGQVWVTWGTRLTLDSATGVAITVSAHGVNLERFALQNIHASAPTAGAGIQTVTGGGNSTKYGPDLTIRGFYHNIDHQAGGQWTMDPSCFLLDWVYSGLKIQNVDDVDFGDMAVSGMFYAGPTNTPNTNGAGILWLSGGGFKGYAIKVNTLAGVSFNVGIQMLIQDGVNTVDFLLTNSSIENCNWGFLLQHAGPNNTGTFSYIVLSGNQFDCTGGTNTAAVAIAPASTGKVDSVFVGGNVIVSTSASQGGVNFGNLNNATHGPNVYKTNTGFVNGTGNTNITAVGAG